MSHDRYYYDCEPEYYYSRPRYYYEPALQSRPEVTVAAPARAAYVEHGHGPYTIAGVAVSDSVGAALDGAAIPMILAGAIGLGGFLFLRMMYRR